MKLKLSEILEMRPGLEALVGLDLPVNISFRIGRMIEPVNEASKKAEEFRIKLINQYGIQDKEKDSKTVPPEKTAEFIKEYEKLLTETVDIPITEINIEELGDINVKPFVFSSLRKIFN